MVRSKLSCPLTKAERLNPVHFAAQLLKFRPRPKPEFGIPNEFTDPEPDMSIDWEPYLDDGRILASDVPRARLLGVKHQPSLGVAGEIIRKLRQASNELQLILAIHPNVRLILEESKVPVIGSWSKTWAGTTDCFQLGKWLLKFGVHCCFGVIGGFLEAGTEANGHQWLWLVILDIDDRDPVRQDEILRKLGKKTLLVRTPGGGLHAYFFSRRKVTNRGSRVYHRNIDIRGQGGQVMAPGAINDEGKTYAYAMDNEFFCEKPAFIPDGWRRLLRDCDEEQEQRYGAEIFQKLHVVLNPQDYEDVEFESRFPRKGRRADRNLEAPKGEERNSRVHLAAHSASVYSKANGKIVNILELPVPLLLKNLQRQSEYKIPESVRWSTCQKLVGYWRGVDDLPSEEIQARLLHIREHQMENPDTFTKEQLFELVSWSRKLKSNQERFNSRYSPRRASISPAISVIFDLESKAIGMLRHDPSARTKLADIIDAFVAFYQRNGISNPSKPHQNPFGRLLRDHGFKQVHIKTGNVWRVDLSVLAQALDASLARSSAGAEPPIVPVATLPQSELLSGSIEAPRAALTPSTFNDRVEDNQSIYQAAAIRTNDTLDRVRASLFKPIVRTPEQIETDRQWKEAFDTEPEIDAQEVLQAFESLCVGLR